MEQRYERLGRPTQHNRAGAVADGTGRGAGMTAGGGATRPGLCSCGRVHMESKNAATAFLGKGCGLQVSFDVHL